MNNKLLGVFIEVLNNEHGEEVIQFFKDNGVNTGKYKGSLTKENYNYYRYYGINNNGIFNSYLKEHCKVILTLEQAKKLVMEDKKQTLTRAQLKELHDAFDCSQWRNHIMDLVIENPFDAHININSCYIKLLKQQGSKEMIAAVRLLGIVIEEEKWVRNPKTLTTLLVNGEADINTYNKLTLLYNMTSWAEHHNKIDNFTSNWNDDSSNYGINIVGGHSVVISSLHKPSNLLFSIAVSSRDRVQQMLDEFKSDIQKIKW